MPGKKLVSTSHSLIAKKIITRSSELKIIIMKNFFSKLLFDKDLVKQIKKVNVNEGLLYNQLINGRITLKEYLAAI